MHEVLTSNTSMNKETIDLLSEEQGLAVLKRFGEVVRRRRVELNLTQEQFSLRAGLHRTYVSNVERGERNLTLLTAIRIAQGLELSLIELLSRSLSAQ